ncbi:acyl-CoA reductase [Allomuricauda sp. d1]|uniref:acyl-CoA reductase n=1 Tax=Allomuricauda sp. d1 TaxID=3136725 RepID=UPI0031D28117
MAEQTDYWKAFVKLGRFLRDFCENRDNDDGHFSNLKKTIHLAQQQNAWFTSENIHFALQQWGDILTEENLKNWLSTYQISKDNGAKTIGIIMAGNIPLVGFHDFLSVLVTGNRALCKLSSNDAVLLPTLAEQLIAFEPSLKSCIAFTENRLENFDAIIATGSNNTSRYFEYYFGKYPNIIRKNRTSVAVLTGNETEEQLKNLGNDIFRYFGLGCRNVSKIFVPHDYDLDPLFNALFEYKSIIEHHKYANNYDYNKAVYLMSDFKILDNGFLILKEDKNLHSPIAALFFEKYDSHNNLRTHLEAEKEQLQCIVGNLEISNEIPFGHTQRPGLADYADGVDTVDFLLTL